MADKRKVFNNTVVVAQGQTPDPSTSKEAIERATTTEVKEDCREIGNKLSGFEDAWHMVRLACRDLIDNVELAAGMTVSSFSLAFGSPFTIWLDRVTQTLSMHISNLQRLCTIPWCTVCVPTLLASHQWNKGLLVTDIYSAVHVSG